MRSRITGQEIVFRVDYYEKKNCQSSPFLSVLASERGRLKIASVYDLMRCNGVLRM